MKKVLVVEDVDMNRELMVQIRNGIEQLKGFVGVSGIYTMSPTDHNGLDLSAFEIVKIVKGDWELVK